MSQRFSYGSRYIGLVAVLCALVMGCGKSDGYRVSGKVTFMGNPVPSGKIYFTPDGKKGATGAAGFADIRNGQYDTSADGGRGAPSGPVVIGLEGIDPSAKSDNADPSGEVTAKLLFARYEVAAEIPEQDSTKDIDVPAEAAKGPPQPAASNVVIP